MVKKKRGIFDDTDTDTDTNDDTDEEDPQDQAYTQWLLDNPEPPKASSAVRFSDHNSDIIPPRIEDYSSWDQWNRDVSKWEQAKDEWDRWAGERSWAWTNLRK